ncbi:DUF2845 domain-containing protein [Desulfospira joergensenii]|uniref:DUF2845 domain-containing protein n=1 Tax=Desulfospira joergensenii TaxID=53329 RepID=UPI0003B4BC6F|nr:DUF2845 domain-containing protein [Desulfospira joergensenii]
MFQKVSILIIAIFILFNIGIAFSGIRCRNDIISVGDAKILVASKIQSCGQIIDKDSYTKKIEISSGKDDIYIDKRIDIWSVRIQERGENYCYPLTFENGILTDIGSWNRCD